MRLKAGFYCRNEAYQASKSLGKQIMAKKMGNHRRRAPP